MRAGIVCGNPKNSILKLPFSRQNINHGFKKEKNGSFLLALLVFSGHSLRLVWAKIGSA